MSLFLPAKNPTDRQEFEKGLYQAFYPMDDSWIKKHYSVNHQEQRLNHEISYYKEYIYIYKNKNELISGCSLNLNSDKEMQLEKMGFSLVEKQRVDLCEILSFFISPKRKNPIKIGLALRRLSGEIIKKKFILFTQLVLLRY